MSSRLQFVVACRCGRHVFRPATHSHTFAGEGWYHASWDCTRRVDVLMPCMRLLEPLDKWPTKSAEARALRTRIVELRKQIEDLLST
jgi:hypothetical protein